MDHLPCSVTEGDMVEADVVTLQRDVFPILIRQFRSLQFFQTVQHRVGDRKDMGGVVDGLHTAEDREGEHGSHQEHRQLQGSVHSLPAGGEHQANSCGLQGNEVQTVPGHKSKLIFDPDVLIGPARLKKPLGGRPLLSEGFDHRKAVDVLNGCPGQCLLGPVSHRSGAGTLPPDAAEGKGGQQHTHHCHQRRLGAEERHAQNDDQYLQIAVDDRIHHLHALQLQGTELRGQSSQNVAQVILREIPQGNPFEQVTKFQSLLRRPLCSDTLLEPVFPVSTHEAQNDQQDDPAQAQPGEPGVQRRPLLGTLDDQPKGPGRQHHRPGSSPGGKKRTETSEIQPPVVPLCPTQNPIHTPKHRQASFPTAQFWAPTWACHSF